MAKLVDSFRTQVDTFERHQGFAEKARSLAGKFSAEVIDKVAGEHEARAIEIASDLVSLTADVDAEMRQLSSEKQQILDGHAPIRDAIDELDLRLAIEEISQAEHDSQKASHEKAMAADLEKVGELDKELAPLKEQFDRWSVLGHRAGVMVN